QLLDLQNAKAAQAKKIATLKKKVKKLERKRRSKPIDFKRFKKAGIVRRKKSSTVKDSLDDADLMFDTLVLEGDKVVAEHAKEPEVVTTVSVITAAVIRPPKTKGIVFHDPEEQSCCDEELAKKVNDEMQAELEEEERIRNEKEEKATLVLIELWKDKQAMMEADRLLCKRLQVGEKEELTIEDKSKLSYEDIERLFEKETKRVNTFILMDQDKESSKKDKSKSKRVGKELESDVSKKQKVDKQVGTNKHVEAKVDDSAELKSCLEIVTEDDDDVTIDAAPLSSKSPSI
ncbi:hypothetical protein Tco_1578935, partial [Tanacetum coccineum]